MFHRKREVISLSVDEDKCTGCEMCVAACKRRVLELKYGLNFNYHAIARFPDDCVGCGRCLRACSFGAIDLVTT